MRDRTKQLLVINTGEKKQSGSGSQTIINQYSSYGSGGSGVDLRDYLLKRIWDTAWELRTTEEGESYIFCKLPFISQHGVTLYADGGNIDLPSLYAGIPVDGTTITKREDGTLMLNPNLELGGLDEEALQKYLDDYNYAKLSDIPSLDGYAKLTDVDSRINDLVNGAPAAYDTLKEIADVLEGNVNSIGDIITTLGTKADKTYVDTELAKYIPIAGNTEVDGIKNFLNGLKVGGLPISKYEGYDDVIYIDANVVLRGGLTQYAVDPVTIPSIIDSLPIAGYESKGVASFSSDFFAIDANGKVSIIPDSVGLNEEELEAWLANSDYATKTYADDTFATKSSLNATNTEVAKKWTQDDDKIANWDTAYGWGNHASAGYALSTEVAVELAKYLPLSGGKMSGDITLPNKKYIRTVSNSYAILGMDGSKYVLAAPNYPTTIRSNGTLKHNNATIWDSNTLTSLSQLNNDADFTTNAYVNETFVTLKGDPQTIESEKNFTGGLKVNGSPIVYDSENCYWLLQGNLLITGGLTQYVDDGSVDLPNLYDGLPIDNQTIYWEETANGKVLKAQGGGGGITSITDAMIIEALGYTPYNASNPNGYITSAALNGYATQTWVNQQGFLTEHQSLDGYVNEIATTGTGNAVTSISKSGKKLTFTKGATYLTTTVANGLYHPLTTFATVATSGSYNDLSNKPTIPTSLKNPYALSWSGYSSGSYDGSAAQSITIPSNTNQLTNGAGFITSSGYSSGVLDYNQTSQYIKIGYTGTGLTSSNASHLAAYGQNASGERVIKDISKSEVQAWLGLGSNAYNSTAYLPLSGVTSGILTRSSTDTPLYLKGNAASTFLGFKDSSDKTLGFIGVTSLNRPQFYYNGNGYTIWHSGNDGSGSGLDADLLDGVHLSGLLTSVSSSADTNLSITVGGVTKSIASLYSKNAMSFYTPWNNPTSGSYDLNSHLLGMARYYGSGGTLLNAPSSFGYGSILALSTGMASISGQLAWNINHASTTDTTKALYWRAADSSNGYTYAKWHQIAFTDSNVASATKLQTARTIWGQSFDGTGNITGTLTISGGNAGGMTQGAGALLVGSPTGGHIMIDQNDIQAKLNGTDAGPLYLNDWGGNVLIARNSNVGIGTTSPAQKLHVAGTIKATAYRGGNIAIECDSSGSNNNGDNNAKIDSFGAKLYLQSLSTTDLVACYGGGNFSIGTIQSTAKLDVYGAIRSRAYNAISNNNAAFIWDKPGTNYTGMGSSGITDTIYFGACTEAGAWVTTYSQIWKFGGNILTTGGITQYSDIRKKTKLNDVELTLKQIANAPLIEHYYNSDDKKTTHVGSIAQYWAEMNDWFCKLDSDGFYTMEIQNAALASAISVARELERYESKTDKKIRMLKKRINELEDEIEKLKSA